MSQFWKQPYDKLTITISFSDQLGLGGTINAIAQVSATNLATQANATALIISGAPSISNNVNVSMVVQDGNAGNRFLIDTQIVSNAGDQFEDKSTLEIRGSSLDLTDLDAVKRRAEVTSTVDDEEIQDAITGFSQHILNFCGMASLNSVVSLDETYNGNGNQVLAMRSFPVVNLSAVVMNGVSLPLSAAWNQWGVYIHQSKKFIAMRGGIGAFSTFPYPSSYISPYRYGKGPVFMIGQGNIEVVYSAGYSGVPYDLEYAVRCVVALNYKRKAWQDQASRSTSVQGASMTTAYRNWNWPSEYENIFQFYQRKAIIT